MIHLDGRRVVHLMDSGQGPGFGQADRLHFLADAGLESIVVSPPGPLEVALDDRGIPHVPLRQTTSPTRSLVEVTRLLRRIRPDIVHVHGPGSGHVGRVAARAAGVPGIVHTASGSTATLPTTGPGGPMAARVAGGGLERLAVTCSHVELVEHPVDLATLARWRVPADRLVLIGTGVDLDRFRPRRSSNEIAAARSLLSIDPSAVVVAVVGADTTDNARSDLMATTRRLNVLMPEVVFVHIDAVLSPEDLHPGVDIALLASPGDRLSQSAMEVLAAGLPIIAVDSAAGRRAVNDRGNGPNGIVVPSQDAQALAKAIANLASDPASRGTMGARSRAVAESEFDERKVIGKVIDAYERLSARLPSATSGYS